MAKYKLTNFLKESHPSNDQWLEAFKDALGFETLISPSYIMGKYGHLRPEKAAELFMNDSTATQMAHDEETYRKETGLEEDAVEEAKKPVSKEQKIQVVKEWIWFTCGEGTKTDDINKYNKMVDMYFADKDDVTEEDFRKIYTKVIEKYGVGDIGADWESFKDDWKDVQKGSLVNPKMKYEEKFSKETGLEEDVNPYKISNRLFDYTATPANMGSTGEELNFNIIEVTPTSFTIEYRITPNSPNRSIGASRNYRREPIEGVADIEKDFQNPKSIQVRGTNFTVRSGEFMDQVYGDAASVAEGEFKFRPSETDAPGMQARPDGYLKDKPEVKESIDYTHMMKVRAGIIK